MGCLVAASNRTCLEKTAGGSAQILASQPAAIPVFLKRKINAWEYVGDYRLRELSQDRAVIDSHAARADRVGDVSIVLFLESVNR